MAIYLASFIISILN